MNRELLPKMLHFFRRVKQESEETWKGWDLWLRIEVRVRTLNPLQQSLPTKSSLLKWSNLSKAQTFWHPREQILLTKTSTILIMPTRIRQINPNRCQQTKVKDWTLWHKLRCNKVKLARLWHCLKSWQLLKRQMWSDLRKGHQRVWELQKPLQILLPCTSLSWPRKEMLVFQVQHLNPPPIRWWIWVRVSKSRSVR